MPLPHLLTFPDAARQLGVPVDSLRRVADRHGKTIVIGRACRLLATDLEELIELCRVNARGPASTGRNARAEPGSGRSATEPPTFRPAPTIARRLKASSRSISGESTGRVDRQPRTT
jgi:hypothetical protein